MRRPISALDLRVESDLVLARQRARTVAEALGFDPLEQTRIATAISELARNAFRYASGGRLELLLEEGEDGAMLIASVTDHGPGIPHLERVLSGDYVSSTGMGLGLVGAQRLSDRFDVRTSPDTGTTVEIGKRVPARLPSRSARSLGAVVDSIRSEESATMLREMDTQHHEMRRLLDELRLREADVGRLSIELEETNRGVMALYAELDDRVEDLRRASEMKSRFLSMISHELRTPLTSVLNLTRLLLDRVDGDLTAEQERQVRLIRQSVSNLTEMVNDLLDLARIEAGKAVMRFTTLSVVELFSALRGMFRPLVREGVPLVFDDVDSSLTLCTDEGKLAQVLRNFISNALKFTETGEVRVSADVHNPTMITLTVRDTGVGISRSDQQRLFQEFFQVDGQHQRRASGTGLGLSISKRIAELLGGDVSMESVLGRGSSFAITIPRVHPEAPADLCAGASTDRATEDHARTAAHG